MAGFGDFPTKRIEEHPRCRDHLERVVVDIQRDPLPLLLLCPIEPGKQALALLVRLARSFHGRSERPLGLPGVQISRLETNRHLIERSSQLPISPRP